MISGRIRNRDALIELEVVGAAGQPERFEAVIDTGYNGLLTLPDDAISRLQLAFAGSRRAMLADGSIVNIDQYEALVLWHGRTRDVVVTQVSGTPIVGMSLLEGSRVTMDVKDGGDVTVEELPP